MVKLEAEQVAYPQTEVDADYKKHVVSVPVILNQEFTHFVNIIYTLNGICCLLYIGLSRDGGDLGLN